MDINSLPPELFVWILTYLTKEELVYAKYVCKYWWKISQSQCLWKSLNLVTFHVSNETEQQTVLKNVLNNSDKIKYLKIPAELLRKLLLYRDDINIVESGVKHHKPINFHNVVYLHLAKFRVYSSEIFSLIASRCQNVKSLTFKSSTASVLKEAFQAMAELKLEEIDITCDEDDAISTTLIKVLIENYPGLNKLSMTAFSNEEVTLILRKFKQLYSLRAPRSLVSSSSFREMPLLTNLHQLHLDYTEIDDESLKHISQNAPNLTFLSVLACDGISNRGIHVVTTCCKRLEYLRIGGGEQSVTSKLSLSSIAHDCTTLKYLASQFTYNLSRVQLARITQSCDHLFHLNLIGCDGLNDSCLEVIAEYCLMLQEADFSYCIEITIQGVDHILSKCVWLEKLCLSKCSGLSELQPLDTSLKQESYTGNHFQNLQIQNPESEMQTLPKAASLTEKSGTNLSSSSEDSIATVHTNGNEVITICQESSPVKSNQNLNSPLIHKGDNQRDKSPNQKRHSELKILDLSSCSNLRPEVVVWITEQCPDLRSLNLLHCHQMTSFDARMMLHGIFRNCSFLHFIPLEHNDNIYSNEKSFH